MSPLLNQQNLYRKIDFLRLIHYSATFQLFCTDPPTQVGYPIEIAHRIQWSVRSTILQFEELESPQGSNLSSTTRIEYMLKNSVHFTVRIRSPPLIRKKGAAACALAKIAPCVNACQEKYCEKGRGLVLVLFAKLMQQWPFINERHILRATKNLFLYVYKKQ
jgi:hypothetical protein